MPPPTRLSEKPALAGFTLIELSIVLVIIGLLAGGVLVGRDLIKAAEVRAQISQIDKYQQAVNTFKGKYGNLPGDIPNPDAVNFGFAPRGTNPGQGDGNGTIQAYNSNGVQGLSLSGEIAMFWVDLSTAKLIDQSFSTANATAYGFSGSTSLYQPTAAIGQNNYVGVWSTGGNGLTGIFFLLKQLHMDLD